MFRGILRSASRVATRTALTGAVVLGTLEVTTHLPSQGRSSKAYHTVADEWVTPAMRRFLSAETAHQAAIFVSQRGLTPHYHPSDTEKQLNRTEVTAMGVAFPNAIGLAAGFDVNGNVMDPMLKLGFGSIEVGTVTTEPHTPTKLRRMWRLPDDQAILHSHASQSEGVDAVRARLDMFRAANLGKESMQWWESIWNTIYGAKPATGPIGASLGSTAVSIEEATAEYVSMIEKLGPFADYIVLNVPPTTDLDNLESLVMRCIETCRAVEGDQKTPLLIKVSLSWTDDQLRRVADICLQTGIDGVVVGNSPSQRPNDLIANQHKKVPALLMDDRHEPLLSGLPVKDTSTRAIRLLYAHTNGQLPIVGVGGVSSGQDAYDKLKAGASLTQVYSALIYHGPGLVSRIREELAEIMVEHGQKSVDEVIGLDHEEIYWKRRHDRGEGQETETTSASSHDGPILAH